MGLRKKLTRWLFPKKKKVALVVQRFVVKEKLQHFVQKGTDVLFIGQIACGRYDKIFIFPYNSTSLLEQKRMDDYCQQYLPLKLKPNSKGIEYVG